ncbi:MAG TPA: hypothetical protein VFF65_04530, partial [Phycisphaerales bacterium]|nr:hypothetical protein [Phycisphaerales bacterium]
MAASIDGSAWTAGMVVNAANVGVATIASSGTLSCVAASASDLWPNANAGCYIKASAGASLTVLIESATFGGSPSSGDKATHTWWVRAKRTDRGVSLVDGGFGFLNNTTVNGKAIWDLISVKKDTNQPGFGGGLIMQSYNQTDSAGRGLTEAGPCVNADGSYNLAANLASMAFDQWTQLWRQRVAGASGYFNNGVNGQAIQRIVFDAGTTAAQLNAFTMVFPALAG